MAFSASIGYESETLLFSYYTIFLNTSSGCNVPAVTLDLQVEVAFQIDFSLSF